MTLDSWIKQRIGHLKSLLPLFERGTPVAIAMGGQITAYNNMAHYVQTHPPLADFITDLYCEGCIIWSASDNASDFICRYCCERTKSNIDRTIEHAADCMWLRIQQLEKDKA